MKIYIHTDLEGAVGVDHIDMIFAGGKLTETAYQNLIWDINAAAEGAFEAGADTVTVLDSHGGGGGIDPALLDARIDFDKKENGKWWGKLDGSYDASLFIGAHAMAGTINGFLDHTMNSAQWYNYYLNGRRTGELGIWAAVCGHYNVPLIMVSGDQAACAEARAFLGNLETVAVKQGAGRNTCVMYDQKQSRENIRSAVRRAVKNGMDAKPYRPIFPAEVRLELCRADFCEELLMQHPGAERMDARCLRKLAENALEILL